MATTYNKNYPLYDVVKFDTIKEMISMAENEAGDKTAFRYKDGDGIADVTYSQFVKDIRELGTGIASLGLAASHIAMVGENSYKWIVVYLTALQSLGVFVPIDKELPDSDKVNVICDSDSEIVFYSEKYEKSLMENAESMPGVKYFVGLSRAEDAGKFLSFEKLKEKGAALLASGDTSYTDMHDDPSKMKLLVYTSGTTGMSKGVMLSEHNLVSCVYYGLQVSTVYDVCLSVLPYHHTYEAVAGLLVSIHHHSTICINENLKSVMKNLAVYKPDYIYLVPAFAEVFYKKIWAQAEASGKAFGLKALIKSSNAMRKVGIDKRQTLFAEIHKAFGGNLKKIVCGGAPIRPEIGKFFDSIGINLINGYGITECSPLVSVNRDYFNNPATVGTILPCLEIKFEDISPDGDGEICVRGDSVMLGYYKHPELTAEAIDEDGWFRTGDYGRMNSKGQLMITGRKKNIIVLDNGKNIYPEELENYITSIPYVAEAVVFGIKDGDGMETALGAEVFFSDEKVKEMKIADPEASLKRDIGKAFFFLPSYKRIRRIYVRATPFEKTSSNKIKRSSVIHN